MMNEIFVIVEHRLDEIREITLEMLRKAGELAQELSYTVTAVLLGHNVNSFAEPLADRADKIVIVDDERLKDFNADLYKEIIAGLIGESKPPLTFIGSTSWGMELAPCLAVKTGFPVASDCIDIISEDNRFMVQRQLYSGKIFANVSFAQSSGFIVTIRAGAFSNERIGDRRAQIVQKEFPLTDYTPKKRLSNLLKPLRAMWT